MKTYNVAPMDLAMRIVTLFLFALTAVFAIWGILQPALRGMLAVAAFLLLLIWICWQIAPKRYDLTDDALIIVRGWPFRDISIPTAEIHDVRPVKISPFSTIRTFGVGGLFSASGRFWNKEIGGFYAGITNSKATVLISNSKKYVISPEDADQFLADMESHIGDSRRRNT